jgi:hypothetical protein
MFVLVGLVHVGCAAHTQLKREEEAVDETFEQTIPLEPIDAHPFNPSAFGKPSDDGSELFFKGAVDYALGDGYPTVITQTMTGKRWTACSSPLGGRYRALSVDNGSSESATGKLDEQGNLVLTLHSEGTATLTIKGEYEVSAEGPECGFAPSSTVATSDVMVVQVRRPKQLAVQFSDCYDEPVVRVATNVRVVPGFALVDGKDVVFQPSNANPRHPATLTIRSTEPLEPVQLTAPDGPASEGTVNLLTPETAGLLELEAPFGSPTVVEVVEAKRVTTEVEFGIEVKVWAPLENGDEVAIDWARPIQVLTVDEAVDGTKLCSPLDEAWFTLESLTPEVCAIEQQPNLSPFADHRLQQAALLHASGTCSLRLSAPEFEGGLGLHREFRAEVKQP